MKKNTVAVLDVGSDKITVAVAEKNINNTFVIKGYSSKKYDGFLNGEFLDYIGLEDAVLSTVKQALLSAKEELSLLYVGVPGEFTTVYLKEAQTSFPKPTRLDLNDLSAFYDGAYDVNTKKYTPINRSGEYFVLDEGRKVVNPVGEVCRVLNGKLSYILCENTFINTITPILNKLGDIKIEYVSSALAEALYLFSPEERDKTSILLDVGHLTTTFAIIKGDAVVYQRSFAFGGGFINFALVEKLDIDDDIAEKLKRKINLSCEYADDDEYVVIDGDKEYRFSAKTVNDVVFETLDVLCDYLGDCFAGVKEEIPDYVPISVTGGGIAFFRGAKEHVLSRTNMSVDTLVPSLTFMNKPTDSSMASLISVSLAQPVQKKGFLKKIFGKSGDK